MILTKTEVAQANRNGVQQPGISTVSVHSGEARQKEGHSITDPIVCASTYTFENTDAIIQFIENDENRGEYGRYGSPSEQVVEKKLAALEGAEEAILYASGMAAFVGLLTAKLSAGDEVVFFDECYHRSREFCCKHLSRFGVITKTVKTNDYDALEKAITENTKLLISESPTNPHLSIVDLEKFVAIGKRHNIDTLIDATLATPFNLKPIEYGVDYVLHSATKYLGGHNDLLAGVVAGPSEKLAEVRKLRGILAAVNCATQYLPAGTWFENLRNCACSDTMKTVKRSLNPGATSCGSPRLLSRTIFGPESRNCYSNHEWVWRFGYFEVDTDDWREAAKVVDAARIARIAPAWAALNR